MIKIHEIVRKINRIYVTGDIDGIVLELEEIIQFLKDNKSEIYENRERRKDLNYQVDVLERMRSRGCKKCEIERQSKLVDKLKAN